MIWIDGLWLICCLVWCFHLVKTMWVLLKTPLLERLQPNPPRRWPTLSIVIPARDEAQSIEKTVRTLLAQNYPHFELVLVNDRSADGTGDLMDALAAEDHRIRVLHLTELRDGWLGKVNALDFGAQTTNAEWLLFTDADVRFQPGALRAAMAHALSRDADHLTLMPAFRGASFGLTVTTGAFERAMLAETNVAGIGKPGSKAVAGIGAFNLLRSSVLARSRGLSWLRMEVVDDMGLAVLLQDAGASSLFASGKHYLSLTWYASIAEMFRGLEKNAFSALRYQSWRLVFFVLLCWTMFIAPHAIWFSGSPYLWLAGLAVYLCLIPVGLIWRVRFREKFLPVLLTPCAVAVLSLIVLRAGVLCLYRDGVRWRDTFYSLDRLREGQKFRL